MHKSQNCPAGKWARRLKIFAAKNESVTLILRTLVEEKN